MYPILFHSDRFHITFHSYGLMLGIAFIAGIAHAMRSARLRPAEGISEDDTLTVAIWMIIVGVIFARITYVLLDPNLAQYTWKSALAIWNGGISFDGSLVGALIAMAIYCKLRSIPFLAMADRCSAPAMIGYAIGRVGCLLNGCCYGMPTKMPWGIRFQIDQIGNTPIYTAPSHPTQLYATLISLVFYAILTYREQRGKAFMGEIVCLYMIFSAIERFTIEIWRAGVTSDIVKHTPFTTAQFFCFFLFAVGIAGYALLKRANSGSTKINGVNVKPDVKLIEPDSSSKVSVNATT